MKLLILTVVGLVLLYAGGYVAFILPYKIHIRKSQKKLDELDIKISEKKLEKEIKS